jgi:antitoxin MazE
MKVAKWGNSLAVRLPIAVVEALDLKEGDLIEISATGKHRIEIGHDMSRERAIEQLRALRRPAPPGFKFDREEANAR